MRGRLALVQQLSSATGGISVIVLAFLSWRQGDCLQFALVKGRTEEGEVRSVRQGSKRVPGGTQTQTSAFPNVAPACQGGRASARVASRPLL